MIAAVEHADAVARPIRTIQGEGMVTPRRPITVRYTGGGSERVVPRRDRFAPTHPLVRKHPEWFRLCCNDDRSTAPHQLRDALRGRQRQLEGERGRRAPAATATPTLFGMDAKPKPATPIFGMDSYTARPAARRPAWEL